MRSASTYATAVDQIDHNQSFPHTGFLGHTPVKFATSTNGRRRAVGISAVVDTSHCRGNGNDARPVGGGHREHLRIDPRGPHAEA